MASDEDPIYCLCRLPYDETRFMIECDVCKDWYHGSCVGVQEHQAADIEIYHCPACTPRHGPLLLKKRRNDHRHDYSEEGRNASKAVQTGTVAFLKDLKKRNFPSADDIPIKRVHGSELTPEMFEEEGFDAPIVCEKKEGLGITMPPASFSIHDVEQLVGPMREIDVIDVARQDDIKMIMREWTEYYNSPNREKILNVISLEFSNTKLSEHVSPPSVIRQVSWARTCWPETLPDDTAMVRPEVQKYCLMGVKDSFTDFHIDFGGTSVWYHVLRGEKVFYLVRPTQSNLLLYENWLSSKSQSETFFGDQVDHCYKMVVKQGHTLFIPTGWIHAVLTPIDSLVFGGNFLCSYNIALQLQVYAIEKSVKTPEKYLFPSYETINWYAAKHIVDTVKDYTEEQKPPPHYLSNGAKALHDSLKPWSNRKDYAKVRTQDAAENIQYGKLLKDLSKQLKVIDSLQPKTTPKKQDRKRKSTEKISIKASKKLKGLDILDLHTKESLKTDKETKENIYDFAEEDDSPPQTVSLKVRIPKAGAYVAEVDDKDKISKVKVKDESPTRSKKGVKLKDVKGEVAKEEVKEEAEESPAVTPVKEVPQCLKFKLSNGKMVSTDRKKAKSKLKKQLLKRQLESPTKSKSLLKQELLKQELFKKELEKPSHKEIKNEEVKKKHKKSHDSKDKDKHSKGSKEEDRKKKKKKDSINTKDKDIITSPSSKDKKNSSHSKDKSKSKDKKKSHSNKKKSSESSKKDHKEKKKKPSNESVKKDEKEDMWSPSSGGDKKQDKDSDDDTGLVVDEAPRKKRQASNSTTKPASLKLKLPGSSSGDQPAHPLDSLRGGLNGSISDILTASGYGAQGSSKADNEASGMRDAIAGMLTMSQMGEGGGPGGGGVASSDEAASQSQPSAAEEEEDLMADCYKDGEFVYPSFDLSDDEEEAVFKAKKKSDKDDAWSPRARVVSSVLMEAREHRVGVQKESVHSSLATTAAKLTENPPIERKNQKKIQKPVIKSPEKEFEVEPLPGPSTALDSEEPVNAFRPGIKKPIDPCALNGPPKVSDKVKKPKKGAATAKQRLGKLLKIKKMVF